MFTAWMKFAFDAARLCQETQEVMGLRMMKLAFGGPAGQLEAQRMVAEKGFAFAEAAGSIAAGVPIEQVVNRYRGHVRANKPAAVARLSPDALVLHFLPCRIDHHGGDDCRHHGSTQGNAAGGKGELDL